jgi:carboxymethylenebutenolidase
MPDNQPDGFLALPDSGSGHPVLVLHAWWGLNDTIKGFCRRLADAGFVAFAPDLYHGQVADTIPGAEALGGALDENYQQAQAEIAEATHWLREQHGQSETGIAVVGFSLGAFYALALSAAEPEQVHSVVLFYGAGGGDFSASKAAYLGHFAGDDPYESPANVEELAQTLREAGRSVTFHTYDGTGHWFFEPDRTDAYNAPAAALAWERTLAFLGEAFGG